MDNIKSDSDKLKICCVALVTDCFKWGRKKVERFKHRVRCLYEDILSEIKYKE